MKHQHCRQIAIQRHVRLMRGPVTCGVTRDPTWIQPAPALHISPCPRAARGAGSASGPNLPRIQPSCGDFTFRISCCQCRQAAMVQRSPSPSSRRTVESSSDLSGSRWDPSPCSCDIATRSEGPRQFDRTSKARVAPSDREIMRQSRCLRLVLRSSLAQTELN